MTIYTWDDIKLTTYSVYEQLAHNKYDAILAVARGGLIPATILSYMLGVRNITTIAVKSYSDDNTKLLDFSILSKPDFDIINGKVLVVDDLIETGQTIKIIKDLKYFNEDVKLDFAVLYSKGEPNEYINYVGEVVNSYDWISFPWD